MRDKRNYLVTFVSIGLYRNLSFKLKKCFPFSEPRCTCVSLSTSMIQYKYRHYITDSQRFFLPTTIAAFHVQLKTSVKNAVEII